MSRQDMHEIEEYACIRWLCAVLAMGMGKEAFVIYCTRTLASLATTQHLSALSTTSRSSCIIAQPRLMVSRWSWQILSRSGALARSNLFP